MLPDFPKSKAELLRVVARRIPVLEAEQNPLLAQIKGFTQHEGRSINFEQVDYGSKKQDAEVHEIPVEVRFDQIPFLIGKALEDKLRLLASLSGALKMKMLLARLDEAGEQTGQKLDAGGKPLDGRMLLDMIEIPEAEFDKSGKPTSSFLFHPDMMPAFTKASQELEMTLNSNEDLPPSRTNSANSGVLGRIIENWLTSATERGYQIAFASY